MNTLLLCFALAFTVNSEPSPLVFPAAVSPDDCGACLTNSPLINPVTTTGVSFDVPIQITNGMTKFVVVCDWPSRRELARARVPEPYGRIPIITQVTNGAQHWWTVSGYSNITQVIHFDFTNRAPMGFYFAMGANE